MTWRFSILKSNKILLVCLFSLVACLLPPALVFATVDKQMDFTLQYNLEQGAGKDVTFFLYRLGYKNEQGAYTLNRPYKDYPINFQHENLEDLATTLEGLVQRDKLTPDIQAKTDKNGCLKLKLEEGLYLILGEDFWQGETRYRVSPYLVYLDGKKEGKEPLVSYPKFIEEKKIHKSIHLDLVKIWDDQGYKEKRPGVIEVDLLENGKVKETVKLGSFNNWRYQWKGLNPSSSWLVVEKNLDANHYTMKVTREKHSFTLTNTYVKEKTPPPIPPSKPPQKGLKKIPQTGQAWWPIYLLSGLGSISIGLGFIHEKRREC